MAMIIEEMNPINTNGTFPPTAADATQISVLIPSTQDELRPISARGQGLGQGLGSMTPRDDIPPATNYSEKSLQPHPFESPFQASRRTSRRLNDQMVFPEFPMPRSELDTPTTPVNTQIRFLEEEGDPSMLENNPMKQPGSSTIATNPLTTILPQSVNNNINNNLNPNGTINGNIWPWFIPARFVFIRKRPDFFFPERIYQLTMFQRIFVFFEHPKSSRLGTVYFVLLIGVIVLGVVSLVLATENMYQYSPTTCAEPACNNDPNLCPGIIISIHNHTT